jgi:hypothetical protein
VLVGGQAELHICLHIRYVTSAQHISHFKRKRKVKASDWFIEFNLNWYNYQISTGKYDKCPVRLLPETLYITDIIRGPFPKWYPTTKSPDPFFPTIHDETWQLIKTPKMVAEIWAFSSHSLSDRLCSVNPVQASLSEDSSSNTYAVYISVSTLSTHGTIYLTSPFLFRDTTWNWDSMATYRSSVLVHSLCGLFY